MKKGGKEFGMKGTRMPQEHSEKSMKDLEVCNEKYASRSTMENPEDLERSNNAIANYTKKHKMKY